MFLLYSLAIFILALFFAFYIQRLTQQREGASDMTGAEETVEASEDINPQTGLPVGQKATPPSKTQAEAGLAPASGSPAAQAPAASASMQPGLRYQEPKDAVKLDPMYTSLINTANIAYLKQEMDKLAGIRDRVDKVEKQSQDNAKAIAALGAQLKSTNKQVLGGQDATSKEAVPKVTGLSGEDKSTDVTSGGFGMNTGTKATDQTTKDQTTADKTKSTLPGSNMTGSGLTGSNMTGSNMTGSNMTGSSLTGSSITTSGSGSSFF